MISWSVRAYWPAHPAKPASSAAAHVQVLAKSRALDQLVDAILSGASADDAGPLAALLEAMAHPAAPAGLSESLAHVVVGLGQLASTDPLSVSSDARKSVSAALALLKGGLQARAERSAANGSASQLAGLSTKLDKLEAQLPKTTSLKEQVRLWGEIYAAAQQKLDIVSKGGAGGQAAPELQAALDPLQALQTSLTGRIKVGSSGCLALAGCWATFLDAGHSLCANGASQASDAL